MWNQLMKKFVKWLDPKLSKYRQKPQKYTPKTIEEFIDVLRRTPKDVLSVEDRKKISAIMGFDGRRVSDIMVRKNDMVFVHDKDFLGPLTLDRLYKSGSIHFPVIDDKNHVLGVIHTEALNTLEIKKTDRAIKYLDEHVKYLQVDDTLNFVVSEMRRTNCFYFLVLDQNKELAGFLTFEMLLNYLFAK